MSAEPEPERSLHAAIAEVLPAWEAVYEPGNVSDYLIGYANDEAPAKAAAEAWLRSQSEVTGRLEWLPEERLATGEYDRWFELIERHGDGIDTGPGVIVRRRTAAEEQPETHSCGNCEGVDPDTCFMNPDRPPEQCPRDEFDGYGRQCQKPVGHNLCSFEEQPAVASKPERQTPPPVGYSGKGRVWCLTCPRPNGEDVPVTVDEVDHWEECAHCGRHVVDVAEALASRPDREA